MIQIKFSSSDLSAKYLPNLGRYSTLSYIHPGCYAALPTRRCVCLEIRPVSKYSPCY